MRSFTLGFLAGLVSLAAATGSPSQQLVDFSLPPAKGLKFTAVERITKDGDSILRTDGEVLRSGSGRGGTELIYTQIVTDVTDGKITGIERTYGKCQHWAERRDGKKVERQPQPHFLSGIKVTWAPDSMLVEGMDRKKVDLREGGTLHRQFTRATLTAPCIPLPARAVAVGDSWQPDEAVLREAFGSALPGFVTIRGKEPTRRWDFAFKLTKVEQRNGADCAVIEMKGRVFSQDEPSGDGEYRFRQSMEATGYYSLEHRIVIAMEYRDTYEECLNSTHGGRTTSREQSGTTRRIVEVTIVKPSEER